MEKFTYSGGYFINIGNLSWEEWQNNKLAFRFKETERDHDWVTLSDSSRNIWVLLPTRDGKAYYAYGGQSSWTELYEVKKESVIDQAKGAKFLHLSDLHILAESPKNFDVQSRLNYIKKNYEDHYLIVTGDIIDNEGKVLPGTPLPIGLQHVPMNALVTPPPPVGPIQPHLQKTKEALNNAYNMLKDFAGRIYICPGNHDYGLWGNLYYAEFKQAFEQILADPLNKAVGAVPLGNPLSSKQPRLFWKSPNNIRLISIDTAADPYVAGSAAGLATGSVGGSQLSALTNFFMPGTVIPGLGNMFGWITVMFFHHHPWLHSDPLMELVDSNKLMGVIRGNVDLILFGHKHIAKQYTPADVPFGGIKFGALAAGSSRFETTAYEISFPAVNAPPGIRKVRII